MSSIGEAAQRFLAAFPSSPEVRLVAAAALCWEAERWPAIESVRRHRKWRTRGKQQTNHDYRD